MKNVTFFTLLPESIKGKSMEADKEFLLYVTRAFNFADKNNLNLQNSCGVTTFENSSLDKYFSKLKRRSTVLIISPALVANPSILNNFIKKDVTFRVIEGDYLMKPKLLKELWLEEAKTATINFPDAVDYLIKTEVLTSEGKVRQA
ncbi:hypothetical protein [Oceanobacillus salinisoli]|uniref:hypothetical protein n=1 Tax=Oceanobacillus salinisoli TaxID=2678611 RepID=UPI0012E14C3E|nr:hypothetical protein [Oceanobacillus salinisoli]